jgi:cytosine/uracil/thiamine/allantoin permease
MKEDSTSLHNNSEITSSPLYNRDLAPVPKSERTWTTWNLAAIWVGMAVCIPTYILASYMIKAGISWQVSLIIIGLANLIITVPMVLNGYAGVKYGIPFPVLGRAAFGTKGIFAPSILRAIVACGWFGVQTWIGGLALYSIWNVVTGNTGSAGLDAGKFIAFGIFWLINVYFIWKGTESIKWLESFSAPILILIGILLIIWGSYNAGGFGVVLRESKQLERPDAVMTDINGTPVLSLTPIKDAQGNYKAQEFVVEYQGEAGLVSSGWQQISAGENNLQIIGSDSDVNSIMQGNKDVSVQFREQIDSEYIYSSVLTVPLSLGKTESFADKIWIYLLWITAMVGFWATMSISIADITRYAKSQKSQVTGQFLGLPGTMILYSFVGIFVTAAAVINFKDVMIAADAPWDPVSLIARFENPVVVVTAQFFMIIATLSTNIAANVIAPANVFSNLFPKKLSFRGGGIVAGVIAIIISPWWLLDEISGFLIFVSGLLGPVLGIMICDFFFIRKRKLNIAELYKVKGEYSFSKGFNKIAMIALSIGILTALIGYWIPALDFLYNLSWFTGFLVSFMIYYFFMKPPNGEIVNEIRFQNECKEQFSVVNFQCKGYKYIVPILIKLIIRKN